MFPFNLHLTTDQISKIFNNQVENNKINTNSEEKISDTCSCGGKLYLDTKRNKNVCSSCGLISNIKMDTTELLDIRSPYINLCSNNEYKSNSYMYSSHQTDMKEASIKLLVKEYTKMNDNADVFQKIPKYILDESAKLYVDAILYLNTVSGTKNIYRSKNKHALMAACLFLICKKYKIFKTNTEICTFIGGSISGFDNGFKILDKYIKTNKELLAVYTEDEENICINSMLDIIGINNQEMYKFVSAIVSRCKKYYICISITIKSLVICSILLLQNYYLSKDIDLEKKIYGNKKTEISECTYKMFYDNIMENKSKFQDLFDEYKVIK
jgi:hypothetical protein